MLRGHAQEWRDTRASGMEVSFPEVVPGPRKTAPTRQKILVIEDDRSMHSLYKAILNDPTYTFISAYDGIAGLVSAEAKAPDLILLDVDLPGISGFFICKYLKANPRTASIPIIFISAMSSAEEMVCGLEAKASDYLTKPIKEDDLRRRVEGALGVKRTMDRLAAAFSLAIPLRRAPPPTPMGSQDGSAQDNLRGAQMPNPWMRLGRAMDDLKRHLGRS